MDKYDRFSVTRDAAGRITCLICAETFPDGNLFGEHVENDHPADLDLLSRAYTLESRIKANSLLLPDRDTDSRARRDLADERNGFSRTAKKEGDATSQKVCPICARAFRYHKSFDKHVRDGHSAVFDLLFLAFSLESRVEVNKAFLNVKEAEDGFDEEAFAELEIPALADPMLVNSLQTPRNSSTPRQDHRMPKMFLAKSTEELEVMMSELRERAGRFTKDVFTWYHLSPAGNEEVKVVRPDGRKNGLFSIAMG